MKKWRRQNQEHIKQYWGKYYEKHRQELLANDRARERHKQPGRKMYNHQYDIDARQQRFNLLNQLKYKYGCYYCHIKDEAVLAFHHVNPLEKKFCIATGIAHRRLTDLLNEITKCMIICHNDHARLHRGILPKPKQNARIRLHPDNQHSPGVVKFHRKRVR
jgi:hypothetical protein